MSNIYRYIILSSILLLSFQSIIFAQSSEPKDSVAPIDTTACRMWQGLFLEVDVAPMLMAKLQKQDLKAVQGNVQVNLENRFFPVAEVGYSEISRNSQGFTYSDKGFFGRLGVDFNLLNKKTKTCDQRNFALAGLRLGISPYQYTLGNMFIEDSYWGGRQEIEANDIHSFKLWLEMVLSVRASLYKNIYVGWTVRNKHLVTRDKEGSISSWYIPGYGKNDTSAWEFSYIIGYRF